MSGRAPRRAELVSVEGGDEAPLLTPATRRRRTAAARARRRRLLRIDIALAVLLALATIALAPGMAMVALMALVVLALCGLSLAVERLRTKRALRRAAPDDAAAATPAWHPRAPR
ncbi:MAG TPA: hypothetical protein VMU32_09995 [Solirubrobacteraceae bacterium]|nr:hypothetical protein [Solirubrobacteraceae bacterium]